MTIQEAKNKLVALARSQVGYKEGANNQNKYADDPRITTLYGWNVQNQPWCCTFVNWCFINAFGTIGGQMTYGGSAACATQASYYRRNGAFTQSPNVGDQIFFYSGGGINHTGIVVEVNGASIRTVEGNYSDKVSLCTYQTGNSVIAGYGRPKWTLVSNESASDNFETADTSSDAYLNALASIVGAKPVESSNENLQPNLQQVATSVASSSLEDHHWKPGTLEKSNKYSVDNVIMQGLLTARGFNCGQIDGYFGTLTEIGVNHARRYYGMERNGKCDYPLWIKLLLIER